MSPDDYEETVREIVESIYKRVEGIDPKQNEIRWGRKNKLEGASGHKHQIDVSVTVPRNLLLVECKCWNSKVRVASVLTLVGRVYDISPTFDGLTKGVIVTKTGFQRGAKTVAKYFGIDLQLIRSADEFGFKYKDLLLIQPAPGTAVASTSGPTVVIGKSKST